MTRAASFLPVLVLATLAVLFTSQVQAQTSTGKPECEPLHQLYKDWTAPCTQNGAVIPNVDSDPAWKPCICKPGFFPLAVASEQCAIAGTGKVAQITAASLNALCVGQAGYVDANTQQADSALAPALASATAISQGLPSPTSLPGTDGKSTPNAATSMFSAGSNNVLVAIAAVVLATAAAL
ncbi:hypothetical protein BGZ98_008753 [Dissophora globulifera]|nr:hypothetical protein BGZ98_008753 [Dissophora globulifera]